MSQVDYVIVGGGIGGSSLGFALAEAGHAVTILERETEFRDRIRGEWMAPWGVAELKQLGLYDRFIAVGGHHVDTAINYDELLTPEQAEEFAIAIDQIHPHIPGPLCMEHVIMQKVALDAARDAGANVLRGVGGVQIDTSGQPAVRFQHDGQSLELTCRLIIGADGRSSTVQRQLGLDLETYTMENLIAGLLIDGVGDWPQNVQSTGKAGDVHYLVFPQGNGRARLYAEFSADQRGRFAGRDGPQEMLKVFDQACIRNAGLIANATPIGPCRALPAQSSMIHTPYAKGVVLIGDAAGYNDPIIGQGLSITLRDSRMVADVLRATDEITESMFEPYAEERRERMRRLRFTAEFVTALNARFDPEAVLKRQHAFALLQTDPDRVLVILGAVYAGPETAPAEVFTQAYHDSIFAAGA